MYLRKGQKGKPLKVTLWSEFALIDFSYNVYIKISSVNRIFKQGSKTWKIISKYYFNEAVVGNLICKMYPCPALDTIGNVTITDYYQEYIEALHSLKTIYEKPVHGTKLDAIHIIWDNKIL